MTTETVQKFEIKGMNCQSCVRTIEQTFADHPEFRELHVQLQAPQLQFQSDLTFDETRIQNILDPFKKYTVAAAQPSFLAQVQEKVTLYWPLILLFSLSSLIPAAVTLRTGGSFEHWMHLFMGSTFVALAYFKLLDLKKFAEGFSTYDPLAQAVPVYGLIYPFLELLTGCLFLMGVATQATSMAVIAFLGVTTVGVIRALRRKQTIQCACIGTIFKLPLTHITVAENALMIGMAALSLL